MADWDAFDLLLYEQVEKLVAEQLPVAKGYSADWAQHDLSLFCEQAAVVVTEQQPEPDWQEDADILEQGHSCSEMDLRTVWVQQKEQERATEKAEEEEAIEVQGSAVVRGFRSSVHLVRLVVRSIVGYS